MELQALVKASEREVTLYSDAKSFLEDWEHGVRYDVLFTDIVMKNRPEGMELCRRLSVEGKIFLIVVTNYIEYAPEGYRNGVFRYLLKPVGKEDLEQYRNENQGIRVLRHDLRGHFQMLKSLQESNQKRRMEQYLDAMQAETDWIRELEFTGNQAADIVLNDQKKRAQKMGIPFVCEGTFPWLGELKPMGACPLLSNLLDNACEAFLEEMNPDISVKGGVQEHFWTLVVSNRAEKEHMVCNNRMLAVFSAEYCFHAEMWGQCDRLVTTCLNFSNDFLYMSWYFMV